MHLLTPLTLLLALGTTTLAHPLHRPTHKTKSKADITITESQILTIAPTSNTCDNPPAVGECATAKTAATYTSQSFDKYGVTSKAEQAAVLSLMAFESLDFKYNKNHFPGVAGQGTRNMQSPTFNSKYASSLPSLADKLPSVANSPADLLDLLRANEAFDFGSGAWFLTTQCSDDVRSALQKGDEAGWERYIMGCVGTSVTDERRSYWERAVKALSV
ncbi:uncharacterized protein N7473_013361 [Penicillium subrubescens]|uniref:uncharacterized protein n=1 Tax=Penicillium subrubescens TaxID=1316194 RepID=UPI002545A96D|nr:uncharacterized protein N7473_013361 [Penicillium subrubescens]KAJ5873488.1 hypothetical protein N7473_013361 [Penicillium subrubescens]